MNRPSFHLALLADVQHNKQGDLWVIIDSIVYDLSKFGALHPGGLGVLLDEEVGTSYTRSSPPLARPYTEGPLTF